LWSNPSETAIRILRPCAYHCPQYQQKRGGVVINRNEEFVVEDRGFSTEDVIWAIGIWSVILCLSPVIVFYMLMVA
jgi:hypothetical protein